MTPPTAPAPQCQHNWPAITALAIFGVTIFALALIAGGGLPIRGQWQALCWLAVTVAFTLAAALVFSARRQDHWRNLAHQQAGELAELRQAIRGSYDDDKVRAEGFVRLDPTERVRFRHIVAAAIEEPKR